MDKTQGKQFKKQKEGESINSNHSSKMTHTFVIKACHV